MFKKIFSLGLALFLLNIQIAHASLNLSITTPPSEINADIYTFKITTAPGAKVTVTGGTNEIQPVTDTDEDGKVELTVGLIQNSDNTFSIRAEKDGSISETLQVVINENAGSSGTSGDTTPPTQPILDEYAEEINATTLTFTGMAEAGSTITASKTDGTKLASATTKSNGTFSITVALEQNKRNRINFSAKDSVGNVSTAVQAVVIENGEETEETTTTETNSDIASPFTDTENHWAKEYIETLRIAGIVGGKQTGIFAPDDYLTRAELTKIALNAFEINLHSVSEKPFADVNLADWFAVYIETAKDEGIVKGYNDGFRPNQNVTRAEALKILFTTANFAIPEATTDFTDVATDAWYEKYVAFAKNNEIAGGYSDGTFKPNQPITRAEIAKITVKTMELYSAQKAETETTTEESTETETTDETEFVDGNRLYQNTNYKFSLQYYKNWYYESTSGSGDTILEIGFAKVEDALANAEATLELKNGSLESLGKTNLATETIGTEIRYFVEYSATRHIEIYGSTEIADKIETMAKTLTITN